MSYEALARRWRPRKFEDMLGQEHVLRALTNALDQNRLHHAYLFTGTRGVGKTTVARIFAKSLNCEKGVSSKPCGECSACQQVDEGRFLDLIEVDAASRTGVDDTRELLDNVAYAPGSGRYKVYLIDEVHMFSKSSFNALLKTLEEPPPHVKFLLATTDPQKLPVTVLSRCLQFNLKELPAQMLRPYLSDLLDTEKVSYEDLAVAHVAQAADGSVRDALSLLDQAIAYGQGKVASEEVEAMLGRFSPSRLYDLLNAVADDNPQQVFQQVEELAAYVPDYSFVLGELLALLHQVATLQTIGTIPGAAHDEEGLRQFGDKISRQDVQLWYQIGLMGRRDMPYAPNQRQALEMTLIRMLAFKPFEGSSAVPLARSGPVTAGASSGGDTQATKPAPKNTKPTAADISANNQTALTTRPVGQDRSKNTATKNNPDAIRDQSPAQNSLNESEDGEVALSELPEADINWSPEDWPTILAEIPVTSLPLQIARNCILHEASKNQVHLHLDPAHDSLSTPRRRERLREKMSEYAKGEIQLKVTIAEHSPDNTPAELEKRAENDRLAAARTSIAEDPVVAQIVDQFDGKVSTGSIRPIDNTDKQES